MKLYNTPSHSFTEALMNYLCMRMQFRSIVLNDTLYDDANKEQASKTLNALHTACDIKH